MKVGNETGREPAAAAGRRSSGAGPESAFLDEVGARFAGLRREFHEYVAIEASRLIHSFKRTVVAVVSATVGVLSAITFVVTGVIFAFSGLAGLLGELTARPHLGSLLAGLVGLLLFGVAFLMVRAAFFRLSARRASIGVTSGVGSGEFVFWTASFLVSRSEDATRGSDCLVPIIPAS